MSNKLIIIGAGVDKGLGMPLANELVPEIHKFLESEVGKNFDDEIRKLLPNLRFSYDGFIKQAVDKLATDFKKVKNIKENLEHELKNNKDLSEEQKNKGKLIKKLLDKIQGLQENAKLDNETEKLINAIYPNFKIEDDNIIRINKLSFSKIFESVMESFFEDSIKQPNDPILKHIYKNFMDLENLLLKYFLGFYNEKESDIKKYLYISWTLWAYLVNKEKQIQIDNSVYQKLNDYDIISFNYTCFSQKTNKDSIYFHGQLQKFINLKDRQLCDIENYQELDIIKFITEIIESNLDFDNKKFIIPALIPPIKLKPVLSNEYIDIWHNAQQKIKNAEKIIIAGYSFNYADEHFNDIIRNNKDKPIIIIDPNAKTIKINLKSIFSHEEADYTQNLIQGKPSYEKDKLKIVESKAEEIDIQSLM